VDGTERNHQVVLRDHESTGVRSRLTESKDGDYARSDLGAQPSMVQVVECPCGRDAKGETRRQRAGIPDDPRDDGAELSRCRQLVVASAP
jgi:hypothetical protein